MSALNTTPSAVEHDQFDRPYTVVSADTHTGPRLRQELRPYCPEHLLEEFDQFAAEMDEYHSRAHPLAAVMSEEFIARRKEHSSTPGILDPYARLRDLDADGISAEVIYHGAQNDQSVPFSITGIIAWGSPAYAALEPEGVRIYNRWLADFVSVEPERHVGTAHIPIQNVDACVREVEWAASAGLRAVNLPAPRRDITPYTSPIWEPLWAACAAHNMVLNTHGGAGDVYDYGGGAVAFAMFMTENPFMTRRAQAMLILSGVFERHPTLKLVLTEQFGDWLPEALNDLQAAYHSHLNPALRDELPREPIEYWETNCYIGASFMAKHEAETAVRIGYEDRFLWGSDYPHHEGTWPLTRESLRATFHAIDPTAARKILGENAIDVYGFDRAKLAAVAERIGPRPSEIIEPLNELPNAYTLGFRTRGKWS